MVVVRVLGVDTDSRGAVALLDTEAMSLDVYPLPTTIRTTSKGDNHSELELYVLAMIMVDLTSCADVAWLEQQWSRPEQGLASTFGFGQTYGDCRGSVAAGFRAAGKSETELRQAIHLVPGYKWKNALRLDRGQSVTERKAKARELATRLFPECAAAWNLVKHTSAAEASLIAFYGASVMGARLTPGSIVKPNEKAYTQHARSLIYGPERRTRSK